jgi:tyrosine-protein phosphatase YwqE
MLGFFRTKRALTQLPFQTDMHAHFLPGVDDGAADVEASLQLIHAMQALGYKHLVTTPHIYSELYPNSRSTLQPAYEALMKALQSSGLEITLRYAAEYFLDEHVDALLVSKEPLLTVHDNWVLVETSFVQAPLDLDNRLFGLQVAGYKAILAHPERYAYWHFQRDAYHQLREKGVLLQVNLLSLTGYYGKSVAETARYLVKEGLVDLVGSDCHHDRHIQALKAGATEIVRVLDPLIRKDKLLNNQIF